MKKKISSKNKLIIIATLDLIFLISYITLCYVYPQCLQDAFGFIASMVLMNIATYSFLGELRLTKQNFIRMEDEE